MLERVIKSLEDEKVFNALLVGIAIGFVIPLIAILI